MARDASRSLQDLSTEDATNPKSTAFVELSVVYRERGDLDRALRLCLRGLERHPTHVEAHYELGRIYEVRGDRELALDQWAVVRQLAPDHVAACCASIRLYIEEGRLAEAARGLAEAQEIAPGDSVVQGLWKRLRALQRDGRGEGDAAEFTSLVAEHPGTIGILLVGTNGKVSAARAAGRASDADEDLVRHLSGARSDAERVASHLKLGEWTGMVVESDKQRLAVVPTSAGVLMISTAPEMPPGRAAQVVKKAERAAEAYLETGGR